MLVVALVGPSAAGKTSIIQSLHMEFESIAESYAELDRHRLDNRLTLSKWNFMANWFDRVIALSRSGCELAITDRSPLCAAAYVREGAEEYRALAKLSIRELRGLDIHVRSILVTASLDTLLQRISARLPQQSWRSRFMEEDAGRARRVLDYYESRQCDWESRLDTTVMTLAEATRHVESIILRQRGETLHDQCSQQ